MKKKEAAAFLAVSERTLLRYAADGKITVTYPQSRGKMAVAEFDNADLEKLKAELSSDAIRPAVQASGASQAMTRREDSLSQAVILERVTQSQTDGFNRLVEAMTAARHTLSPSDKLLLTLDDCSLLSSLSKQYLSAAIKEGRLKGRKIGKGWKVKRDDLQAFIKRL
jgi:excisionase family DNA binding protein